MTTDIPTEIVEKYGLKWEIRTNHYSDKFVVDEACYNRLFKLDRLTPEDIWIDVGANIGIFCVRVAPHVEKVIAFEPEHRNFVQLTRNIELNGLQNIDEYEAAVGEKDGSALLYVASNPGRHRLGSVRGRPAVPVELVDINRVVQENGATKLKIDCEGGEKPILDALDLDPVEELIFEWHFPQLHDERWVHYNAMLDRLEGEGFDVFAPRKQSKRWTAIVHAWR